MASSKPQIQVCENITRKQHEKKRGSRDSKADEELEHILADRPQEADEILK
jgi:hypothetical protein